MSWYPIIKRCQESQLYGSRPVNEIFVFQSNLFEVTSLRLLLYIEVSTLVAFFFPSSLLIIFFILSYFFNYDFVGYEHIKSIIDKRQIMVQHCFSKKMVRDAIVNY